MCTKLIIIKGYSLYKRDVCFTAAAVDFPKGMRAPEELVLHEEGSGIVRPSPFVLCLPAGSLVMYSALVHSYLYQENSTD